MSVKRLYNLREHFFDSNGDPLSGGQLFVYLAGSSTRSTTYNSSTGLSANTNPLVLDSSGRLQAEVWVATALSYKLVLGLTGDGTAFVDPSSPVWTEDNVTGINDTTGLDQQWITGPTPTYIGATQFSLVGDQTTNFEVGRRVKATVTAGTVYGTIKTVFGAVTTVTLTEQSASLDSGLSAVYYSVLSVTGDTRPRSDAIPVSSGSSDPSKMLRIEADGITTGTTRIWTAQDRSLTIGTLLATAQASTSGTSIDFTSIPDFVRILGVEFVGVSTNGTSNPLIQIGAGSVSATGYLGASAFNSDAAAVAVSNYTTGFGILAAAAANILHGMLVIALENISGTWVCQGVIAYSSSASLATTGGSKALGGTLDRVRVTTVGGANTFDAGEINLIYLG